MKQFTRFVLFGLSVIFGLEILFLSSHIDALEKAPVYFWILAGFATMRLAHTVSFDNIGDWIRFPFTKVVQDTAGGSESVEPKEGRLEAIGMLLSCPICTGTWSATFLVTVYSLSPALGLALVIPLGLAGISEIFSALTEFLCWAGRDHREQAGSLWLIKNKGSYVGAFAPVQEEEKFQAVPLNGKEKQAV